MSDCLSDPSWKQLRKIFRQEGICALAFLPLCCDSLLVGKFMIYYNTSHEFTENEINLAKTISRLVGFVIERTRHEEAIRRRLLEKQLLLRELHHRVKNRLPRRQDATTTFPTALWTLVPSWLQLDLSLAAAAGRSGSFARV